MACIDKCDEKRSAKSGFYSVTQMNNSKPKDKSPHNSDEQSAQPPSVRILETFKFHGSSQKPEAHVEPFPESVVDQLLQEADELYAKRKKSTRQ